MTTRRTIAIFGLMTLPVLGACSSGDAAEAGDTAAAAAPSPQSSETSPAGTTDASTMLRDAFSAGSSGEVWFSSVDTLELDGRAVVARTTFLEGDEAILPACEAAYAAARSSGVDFVSVAVRDARDNTLASRNELRGDVACA